MAWYLFLEDAFIETYVPSLPAINAANFSQAAESNTAVVFLLWAVWDPTSRSLDARLQRVNEDYANLRFYAMDLDQEQNWPLARECGIMTTPTLVCVFHGVFHEMQVGLGPELRMRAKLSEWSSLSDK